MKNLMTLVGFFMMLTITAYADVTITDIASNSTSSTSTQNYNLTFSLQNGGDEIKDWAIGFYMPRTYNTLGTTNPGLEMNIQEASNPANTATLNFIESSNAIMSKIYAQGYFNLLTPSEGTAFPLKKNTQYLVSLNNNNQWAPANLSAMPQSFFIITNYGHASEKPNFINITTAPNAYSIGGYNQSDITNQIQSQLSSYLTTSSDADTNSLTDKYNLVPSPVSIVQLDGESILSKNSKFMLVDEFHGDVSTDSTVKFISDELNKSSSQNGSAYQIKVRKLASPETINNDPEGYVLTINKDSAVIEVCNRPGIFYAYQTLSQLLYSSNGDLPCLKIVDYPRFKYRGVLLDTARHFFRVEEVEKLIDIISAHKLNTLHIHFSDDEACSIDLDNPKLAKLHDIGSARGFAKGSQRSPAQFIQANLDITNYENFTPGEKVITTNEKAYPYANDLCRHYFTPEDIRTLISYANAREVTIIPEMDFPGHSRANIQSMPQVLIDPSDTSQYLSNQGFYQNVLPVYLYNTSTEQGKKFTETINEIIVSLNSLFRNQTTVYADSAEVSVGGDEVPQDSLTNNSTTPLIWRDKNSLEKSIYFFKLIQEENSNLKLSGWQQFVQYGNANGTINELIANPAKNTGHVWVWAQSNQGGIAQAQTLAKHNYPTVLAFADNVYFDLTYTPAKWEPGFYWAGSFLDTHSALSVALNANQVLAGLNAEQQANIHGLEGTLWSENIPTLRHLEYMALPKMSGLAEAAWAPSDTTVQSVTSQGNVSYLINWKSLVNRLGNGKNGFLSYLSSKYDVIYRGYPNGITDELPQ